LVDEFSIGHQGGISTSTRPVLKLAQYTSNGFLEGVEWLKPVEK